ncbi:condensation domain-containing protein [Methanosphaerula palustris]|uniref:Condensation domain protein n=1 Tax=Methanosphaerula palustris (strain ATCC BAA-1556 / DSM 19958 / E1-9c) TaxID=521011 RepID=B8GJK5_METPE|nr:condensation domain-containing protein [Methanosphaerula palustris]ACL17046.1 condensation domain protein [Methanosphaerula palustris E1-9c]
MYTREASNLDLFTDSVRLMGDATLCAVIEFDRRLDPCTLEEAAQACLRAHPILHSQLVRGKGTVIWNMIEPARIPTLKVEECAGNYHHLVIGPVDPYGSLQFRVRLLRRTEGDIIVINLAHAAADAYGLQILTSQLLQEYQRPGSISPAEGGIPERDTLWTRELDPEEKPAPSEMKVINPMWPDPFGTSRKPSSYHRDWVSPSELERVHTHVRTLGGTINDAVMAAYYLSISDLTGHCEPMAIFFPVNLRQHQNDGSRVMSNQANNVCFMMERRAGEEIEEILPRVIEETKILKAGRIGIAEQIEMDTICDPEGRRIDQMVEEMIALQNMGLADIFISNPGLFNLPDVEGLSDAYLCYPGGYMPTTCFMTSTFRGRMTITMGYQNSDQAREGTRRAMDLFRRHLLSLVDGS